MADAALVANAVCDDEDTGDIARRRLRDAPLHAPHLIDAEVLSAVRGMVLGHRLELGRAERGLRDFDALHIHRHAQGPALRRRAWSLRDNLTPYDAAYVALAEALACPLVTADARIARAPGTRCEIEIITPTR